MDYEKEIAELKQGMAHFEEYSRTQATTSLQMAGELQATRAALMGLLYAIAPLPDFRKAIAQALESQYAVLLGEAEENIRVAEFERCRQAFEEAASSDPSSPQGA